MTWALYSLALLLVAVAVLPGWTAGRGGDFFLAGRRVGPLGVGLSLLATCLGASATLGAAGMAYTLGWGAFWWLGAGAIGLAALGTRWAGVMRSDTRAATLPQWAGNTYGTPARRLSAGLIAIMWTGVIAAQWVAAGAVLKALVGLPAAGGAALAAVITTAYTAYGGQGAVVRSDRWQVVLVLAAVLIAVVAAAGLPQPAAAAALPPAGGLSPMTFAAWLIVVGGMYVVGPDLCSRVLIARDARAARLGALGAAAALALVSAAVVSAGVAVRRSGVVLGSARAALPFLLSRDAGVPDWLAITARGGLLAAMLSSADTCLLTAGSVIELDLVGQERRPADQAVFGRLAVGAVGCLSLCVATVRPGIIRNMLLAYAFYTGGLLAPLLLLAKPQAAAAVPKACVWGAMAIGGTLPVALQLSGAVSDMAVAGLCGFAACTVILAVGAAMARMTPRRATAPGDDDCA